MSGKFDNNNRGVLFKNNKDGVDTRADYRGNAEINHVEYWLDAWLNTSRDGLTKFLNIRFKRKQPSDATTRSSTPPPPDFDDKIPF